MAGTIINGLSIILGALLGAYIIKSVPPKIHSGLLSSIGLTSILIGLKSAWNADILLTIVSLAVGAAIGEILAIEDRLRHAAERQFDVLHRRDGDRGAPRERAHGEARHVARQIGP